MRSNSLASDATPKPQIGPQDWHKADIVAAVHKAGWTLKGLSLHHGYSNKNSLSCALQRKWPKAERLIAECIGIDPQTIWPSRYQEKHKATVQKTLVRAYGKNKQASGSHTASDVRKAA